MDLLQRLFQPFMISIYLFVIGLFYRIYLNRKLSSEQIQQIAYDKKYIRNWSILASLMFIFISFTFAFQEINNSKLSNIFFIFVLISGIIINQLNSKVLRKHFNTEQTKIHAKTHMIIQTSLLFLLIISLTKILT